RGRRPAQAKARPTGPRRSGFASAASCLRWLLVAGSADLRRPGFTFMHDSYVARGWIRSSGSVAFTDQARIRRRRAGAARRHRDREAVVLCVADARGDVDADVADRVGQRAAVEECGVVEVAL